MNERTPVLVLGLGNVLCTDDGLGVAVVHRLLREYRLPEGVTALDGGTLGMALLPLVDSARRVILVDAIVADGGPGTHVRLEGEEVPPAVYERLSPHQIGVSDVLSGASWLDRYPDRVVLLGLVPESIELGLGRTTAVEEQIPELVLRVVEELGAMGYPPDPAGSSDEDVGDMDRVARTLGL